MVDMRGLDRVMSFDRKAGIIRAQAGITLDEIARLCVPHGWFLPTTPGTRFVTLGGAIANDVHGKNHHRAGTFGHAVEEISLVRSDADRETLSPRRNPELFAATIGGLG